jgi:hypothetical protein
LKKLRKANIWVNSIGYIGAFYYAFAILLSDKYEAGIPATTAALFRHQVPAFFVQMTLLLISIFYKGGNVKTLRIVLLISILIILYNTVTFMLTDLTPLPDDGC